jgi:Xanthomonas XOO_2897-like deaminase
VPARYRQVSYGSTSESRLVQAARLSDCSRKNVYGVVTWTDNHGNTYRAVAHSDKVGHAEQHLLTAMRNQVAEQHGTAPEQVDLSQMRKVRMFVEYSPCDTPPRWCQQDLAQAVPDADVSYSWPWNPRAARDRSRAEFTAAIDSLLQKGNAGPT